MNYNLFRTLSFLMYTLTILASGSAPAISPEASTGTTSVTNTDKPGEVTAEVNPDAFKNEKDFTFERVESEVPANKKKETAEDVAKKEIKDGLEPISSVQLFALTEEAFKLPVTVLVATQKALEESIAPGNPQTVQMPGTEAKEDSTSSNSESPTSNTNDKNKEEPKEGEKKDAPPSTAEESKK